MSVTLSEVRRAARAHRAPLAGESAGYLVLALADQVLSAPRLIDACDIQLTDDGGLRVLRGQASSETDAELSLRRALDELLLVASSGSAALMRAGRRVSPVGLPALVRELEAALIPVNRAAAQRALARLQRETARALASGTLAEEKPEVREPAAQPTVSVSAPEPEPDHLETLAIALPTCEPLAPPAASDLDGVQSALCDQPYERVEESPLVDALTIALDLRAPSDGAEIVLLEEDVEFIEEEPSDALTVARNIEVQPIAVLLEDASVELPEEACTRPEPVIRRQALRPLAQPDPEPLRPSLEVGSRTPTLGSLAAELPTLAPELIAEMTRRVVSEAQSAAVEPHALVPLSPESSAPPVGAEAEVVCSAQNDECTEPTPEVSPLVPGVAIVASRKSDISELLADFQVAKHDTHQDLRRAIKELAELDLTPAPFAALIR